LSNNVSILKRGTAADPRGLVAGAPIYLAKAKNDEMSDVQARDNSTLAQALR